MSRLIRLPPFISTQSPPYSQFKIFLCRSCVTISPRKYLPMIEILTHALASIETSSSSYYSQNISTSCKIATTVSYSSRFSKLTWWSLIQAAMLGWCVADGCVLTTHRLVFSLGMWLAGNGSPSTSQTTGSANNISIQNFSTEQDKIMHNKQFLLLQ